MTQLFDQMTVPDPVPPPPPRPVDVRLELDRLFNTAASNALDLSRFSSPPSGLHRPPRTPPAAWLRAKAPGVILVVAGVLLGLAAARV